MTKTKPLTPAESLVLDVIRVVAAIAVAASHVGQHFFSVGWTGLDKLAQGAVAIFFVLSGFVIRHVTCRRRGSFANYLNDRASRIYSVALPALLLTWAADSISRSVSPVFYNVNWGGGATHPVLRILENLLFTAQLWFRDQTPLSNSPFWSLNYEVIYYILYGCAFYLAGGKRVFWITVVMLIAGPKILLLFPVWMVGYLAHDLYQEWNSVGKTAFYLDRLLLGSLVLATVVFLLIRFDHTLTGQLLALRDELKPTIVSMGFGKSAGALTFYPVAIFGTVIFLRLLCIAQRFPIDREAKGTEAVRFIAEGTFPIYVLHFPLLVLIAACIPYNHSGGYQKIVLLFAVSVIGILAGHPLNMLKRTFRSWGPQDVRRS